MALPDSVEEFLASHAYGVTGGVPVKRGEEMFAGTDYPREWSEFVGQEVAKRQLQVALASARARGTKIDHVLIASGIAGVGKSTLATILAYQSGGGLVQTSGPLTVDDARRIFQSMSDGDFLFVDEAHKLVDGNRNRADWLLPWMLENRLYTSRGAEETPKVTLVAATTDAGKLPATLLGRFMITLKIVKYTDAEATLIAENLAQRMGVTVPESYYSQVAKAAAANPRVMRRILSTLRDIGHASPGESPDLALALEWCGVSYDGLDTMAQDVMLVLLTSPNHTCSIESLQAQLNEPGPLRHAEQTLLQRGYLTISGRGRQLTDAGRSRAVALVQERR